MDTYLIRVRNENLNYRIKTKWNHHNFDLLILDKGTAYKANVTEKDLVKLSAHLNNIDTNFEEYMAKLKTSLCENNAHGFEYVLQGDKFKIYIRGKLRVEYASFLVEEIKYDESVENLIDDFMSMNTYYRNQLKTIEEERDSALEAQRKSVQELEEFIELKEDSEHDLYSKFILLLNEKKKRIQYLQEVMGRFKNGEILDDETCSEDSIDVKCTVSEARREVISNSESDTDEETTPWNAAEHRDSESDEVMPKQVKTEAAADEDGAASRVKQQESSEELDFNTQDILSRM